MTDLEKQVLQATQQGIAKSIQENLSGYHSPLSKLVTQVVNEHSTELKSIISESFESVIRTEDFKRSIVSAFSHKIARTIISQNDSMFEKVGNELKQDSVFKAKMALAVSSVVEDCLRERKAPTVQG